MKFVERLRKLLNGVKGLRQEEGLTLIEVLAVVVILGIIAAIAVPAVTKAIDQAKLNSTESTLGTLQTALERYYFDEGEYPKNLNSLLSTSGVVGTGSNPTGAWQGPYVKGSFPMNDAWGNSVYYGYVTNSSNVVSGYVLLSGDGTAVTVTPGTTGGKVSTDQTVSTTDYVYGAGGSTNSGSIGLNPSVGALGTSGTLFDAISAANLGSAATNGTGTFTNQ